MPLCGEIVQHLGAGCPGTVLVPLAAGQRHLVEQDFAQLLGRADIEFLSGQLVNLGHKFRHPAGKILAEGAQLRDIDQNAFPFHIGQHMNQRAFDGFINGCQLFQRQPGFQYLPQPIGHIGVFCSVIQRLVEGDFRKPDLRFSAADHILVLDGVIAEMQFCQFVHAVTMQTALQHMRQQHRVVAGADHDVVAGQNLDVIFDVLADFQDSRAFQHRFQQLDGAGHGNLFRGILAAAVATVAEIKRALTAAANMAERDITGLSGFGGQRDTDQLCLQRVERGGFRINSHHTKPAGFSDPAFQRGFVLNQFIAAVIDVFCRCGQCVFCPQRGRIFRIERAEILCFQERQQHFRVRLVDDEGIKIAVNIHIVAQADQFP